MRWQNLSKWVKSDYLKLVPILGLTFYLAFLPHQGYPYPIHVDEWTHLACSNEIIKEGTAFGLSNPFQGGPPIYNQLVEVGFHTFWAVFHLTTNIGWLTIFKYFPSVIFMITVLSVYILGAKQGLGWQAAFFTCLIPTTVGVLGPDFLVPVSMGLLFIAISLYIALNFKSWWSYIILAILNLFLLALHSATAVALILLLIPYIIINLKGNFKHSVGIALALSIPFLTSLIMFPGIKNQLLLPTLKSLLVPQSLPTHVDIPLIISSFGYLPVLLGLLGTFLSMIKRDKKNYGLVFGLLALLLMYSIYQNYGYGIFMMYNRGPLYIYLMTSVIAGAGLMGIQAIKLPAVLYQRLKLPVIIKNNVGNIICLAVIVITLFFAIPARQQTAYYHMIDNQDYTAFSWIRDNIGSQYKKAILDPWKGVPFTAITGKNVYAWIIQRPGTDARAAYDFLSGECEDTAFLKKNGISIVYTNEPCNNPDLVEVRENIYVLK